MLLVFPVEGQKKNGKVMSKMVLNLRIFSVTIFYVFIYPRKDLEFHDAFVLNYAGDFDWLIIHTCLLLEPTETPGMLDLPGPLPYHDHRHWK